MPPQCPAASISLLKRPHGPFFPSVTRDLSVWCCQGNTPNVDVSKTIELKKRLGCKPFVYFLHRFRKAQLRGGETMANIYINHIVLIHITSYNYRILQVSLWSFNMFQACFNHAYPCFTFYVQDTSRPQWGSFMWAFLESLGLGKMGPWSFRVVWRRLHLKPSSTSIHYIPGIPLCTWDMFVIVPARHGCVCGQEQPLVWH